MLHALECQQLFFVNNSIYSRCLDYRLGLVVFWQLTVLFQYLHLYWDLDEESAYSAKGQLSSAEIMISSEIKSKTLQWNAAERYLDMIHRITNSNTIKIKPKMSWPDVAGNYWNPDFIRNHKAKDIKMENHKLIRSH